VIRPSQIVLGAVLAAPVLLASLKPSTLDIWPPYFPPIASYNPISDVKGWPDRSYFLDEGKRFVGSQSPGETAYIRSQIDRDRADEASRKRRLNSVLLFELCLLAFAAVAYGGRIAVRMIWDK
jgi:hypothetical protein